MVKAKKISKKTQLWINKKLQQKGRHLVLPKIPVHDLSTHSLLDIREPGDAIIALRNELLNHPDVAKDARLGKSFEECLGRIGTYLDIALDGYYNADNLCAMFVTALRNRRNGIKDAHKLAPGLIDAELEERDGTVELVEKEQVKYEAREGEKLQ